MIERSAYFDPGSGDQLGEVDVAETRQISGVVTAAHAGYSCTLRALSVVFSSTLVLTPPGLWRLKWARYM